MRDNNEVIEIMKEEMNKKNLSLSELARRVDMAKSAVSRYFNGTREFPLNRAEDFARVLGIKVEYLLGFEDNLEVYPADQVPVLAEISAGTPLYAEQNLLGHSQIPSFLNTNGKELFYLKVSGDSMDREFKEGDLVLVEKDAAIENGQIAVVLINNHDATVKRVKYAEDKIYLMPESNNSNHLPQVYTADDEVHFIGRVISSQKFY